MAIRDEIRPPVLPHSPVSAHDEDGDDPCVRRLHSLLAELLLKNELLRHQLERYAGLFEKHKQKDHGSGGENSTACNLL